MYYLPTTSLSFSRYGDRIVAIKVLHRGYNSDERASLESRFAREVTMMSRVKHENLVKVTILVEQVFPFVFHYRYFEVLAGSTCISLSVLGSACDRSLQLMVA